MKRLGILFLVLLPLFPALAGRRRAYDAPSGCAMSITPRTIAFEPAGGTAAIDIVPTGICVWQAKTAAGWLTLTSVGHRVTVQAAPNGGATRTSVVDIGGHVITVTQAEQAVIISPPSNLVGNGTFDRDLAGWTNQFSLGRGSAVWSSNNGGSALLTVQDSGGVQQVETCFPARPNMRYDIGSHIFVPAGQTTSGFAMFGVFEMNVPDCQRAPYTASNIINFRTPTDRWEPITSSFTTSSTARSMYVVIGVATPNNPPFRALFDNVFVREKQ